MSIKKLILSSLIITGSGISAIAGDKEKYGDNVLSISPIQITNQGVGLGLNYERDLDKNGIVCLTLPVAIGFSSANNMYYYYTSKRYSTFFFMPGIKFHPAGSKNKVNYAVGPNIAAVFGQRPVNTTHLTYPNNSAKLESRLSIGTMIYNYLDINPSPHLYLGLEMGMGVAYLDQTGGKDSGMMPFLFQMGFKLGYRF